MNRSYETSSTRCGGPTARAHECQINARRIHRRAAYRALSIGSGARLGTTLVRSPLHRGTPMSPAPCPRDFFIRTLAALLAPASQR